VRGAWLDVPHDINDKLATSMATSGARPDRGDCLTRGDSELTQNSQRCGSRAAKR
jgi:hypothetical protein